MLGLKCGRLWDGASPPRRDAQLLVEGDVVIAAPPSCEAAIIDLSGLFVMPGFVDAHSHLSIVPRRGDQLGQLRQPPGRQALRVASNLARDLSGGTTTLRVMAEEDWLDVYARDAIADGSLEGPRLLIATRGLAPTGGHGSARRGYDGVDEVRRAARENLAHGADFLKVFATGGVASGTGLESANYSFEEMAVAVEEASRRGTYVAAHAHGGPGLLEAVRAGVRTIEHAALAGPKEVEAMTAAGCSVVCTFSIVFHREGLEQGDARRPEIQARLGEVRARVGECARDLFDSGLPLALGTDSMHGLMGAEIRTAVELGLDPARALAAATSDGARVLGQEDRIGRLQPGMLADVIALEGDPFEDISAVERVRFVMIGGRVVRHGAS